MKKVVLIALIISPAFLLNSCKKIDTEAADYNYFHLANRWAPYVDGYGKLNWFFTVHDYYYEPVEGLDNSSEFQLLTEGCSVSPSNMSVSKLNYSGFEVDSKTIIAIDLSDGTEGYISDLKEELLTFIDGLETGHEVALYVFDYNVRVRQNFTSNTNLLESAINNLPESGLSDERSLIAAFEELIITARQQESVDESQINLCNLILFTSGPDSEGDFIGLTTLPVGLGTETHLIYLGQDFTQYSDLPTTRSGISSISELSGALSSVVSSLGTTASGIYHLQADTANINICNQQSGSSCTSSGYTSSYSDQNTTVNMLSNISNCPPPYSGGWLEVDLGSSCSFDNFYHFDVSIDGSLVSTDKCEVNMSLSSYAPFSTVEIILRDPNGYISYPTIDYECSVTPSITQTGTVNYTIIKNVNNNTDNPLTSLLRAWL